MNPRSSRRGWGLPWITGAALLLLGSPAVALGQQSVADGAVATRPDTAASGRISPRGAFLRSLVLPGWGQSVLGSPTRGAVYFGLEAGSLWMLFRTRQRLDDAEEEQAFLRAEGRLAPGRQTGLVRAREQQVEDWLVLSLFWLFFAGADAYVGAHLAGFEDNVAVEPAPEGGLQMRTSLPVGRRP